MNINNLKDVLAFWRWPNRVKSLSKELEILKSEHETLKAEHKKVVSGQIKLLEWVKTTHRLHRAPEGIRALIQSGKRLVPILLLMFISQCLVAGPAPPFLRTPLTTNTHFGPVPTEGQVPIWNSAANAWSNNTVVGSGGGLTTNANQFLGAPLSIRDGAFLTNVNIQSSLQVSNGHTYLSGPVTNLIQLNLPHLTGSRSAVINAQGDVTNSSEDANWSLYPTNVWNDRQFGSANLTNWSNIPTGAMANVVSTTFLTNWANAISNYVTSATNSASVTNWITQRQPASLNLTNLSGTGAITNVFSESLSNATMKPVVFPSANNFATNYTGRFFGLEQGANITLTPNGSNIVIASTGVGGGESLWTNEAFYAKLIAGTTNSIKVMTNGLMGIAIGDTNRMNSFYGWPFDGLTYISLLDGTTGHDYNASIHGVIDANGYGSFSDLGAFGGTTPSLQRVDKVITNNTTASQASLDLATNGVSYSLSGGSVNNAVSLQVGNPAASVSGVSNMIRATWNGLERFIIQTNGHITLMGITYVPPPSQGAAGSVLTNNGVGGLGWGTDQTSAGGGTLTTNANQFLGVPLSIITGAQITNVDVWGTGVLGLAVRGSNDAAAAENVLIQNQGISPNGVSTIRFASGLASGGSIAKIRVTMVDTNAGLSARMSFQTRLAGAVADRLTINTNGFVGINLPISAAEAPLHIANLAGLGDASIRINQSNNLGYAEFTTTNSVRSTNRYVWSFGSNTVSAGHVTKVHSTAISGGINTVVLTNDIYLDQFNVQWWGADPTGANDSTLAIQAALDWAGNSSHIYIPEGTYRITNLWVNGFDVTITGDGSAVSVLLSTNVHPMIVTAGLRPKFDNFSLNGGSRANYGIYMTNVGGEQGTFRNIEVLDVAGTGIFGQTNSYNLVLDRCKISQCSTGVHLAWNFNKTRIDHSMIYYNTNYGVILGVKDLGPHSGVSIRDSNIEGNQTSTNLLINNVSAMSIDGVYFESEGASSKDIVVDGFASQVAISGMYGNGNGTSTNSIYVIGTTNKVSINNARLIQYATPFISDSDWYVRNSEIGGIYYAEVLRRSGGYEAFNVGTNYVGINRTLILSNSPGSQVGLLRLTGTNGPWYTELGITNGANSTNRILFSLGSNTVSAGQVAKVHSTSISGGINTIVLTNDADNSVAGPAAITNLVSLTLSNATIKPLVVGVGNQAAATNTTGEVRGLEAGTSISLTPNGSNYVIAYTGGAGSALAFTNQLWVEMTGNDATGARNDPSKPFRTMTNAMAATIPGDVINIGVGRFTNFAGPLTISNSVTIRGVDWNNTVLLGTNALATTGVNFKPKDNSVIEHLRLEIAQNLGVPSPILGIHSSFDTGGFTNVTVRNVRFLGFSDNIVIVSGASDPCVMQLIDCEFDTGGDMVVLHGSADSHLKFQRCHFYGHDPIATTTCAYRASTGNATFEFCNFASTNNGPVVKGFEIISTAGARILSSTFNLGCTSGNVSNIMSTSSRPVVLVNCLVTTNTMSGYVLQEPSFVAGVGAGTGVTITTNSSSVLTINASGGSPGGGDMAIQFNQLGSTFAGTNRLYYDRTNESLISASVIGKSSFVATNPASSLGLDIRANIIKTAGGDLNLGADTHEWKIESTDGTFHPDSSGKNLGTVSQRIGTVTARQAEITSVTTSPGVIVTPTVGQGTNLVEWRGTNNVVGLAVSSNGLAMVQTRLDLANAVAFRTNQIDLKLNTYQAFNTALVTNLVLQITNALEGVTTRLDAYGNGRLGGGRTNAWQLLCTVPAGVSIYWPPGTTNGNYDVLVNSNQVVSFTFLGGLGATNILASYRVLEGIGAN